jgi:hypothetical protein
MSPSGYPTRHASGGDGDHERERVGAANYVMFPVGETQRTLEGHFTLVEIDGEVCGWGAIPGDAKVKGCSDEDEAEVYLDIIGSDGASSATHSIRVP